LRLDGALKGQNKPVLGYQCIALGCQCIALVYQCNTIGDGTHSRVCTTHDSSTTTFGALWRSRTSSPPCRRPRVPAPSSSPQVLTPTIPVRVVARHLALGPCRPPPSVPRADVCRSSFCTFDVFPFAASITVTCPICRHLSVPHSKTNAPDRHRPRSAITAPAFLLRSLLFKIN
jgi:hypothetical protein